MAAIFANINTPYINEATLKRVMSPAVKDNIFQQVQTKPGEAVTEKFSTDTSAAEIQVIRVIPNANEARSLGADVNGGWFNNAEVSTPTTQAYSVPIIDMIDYNIDVPAAQQDMMNIDVVEGELSNLSGKVARSVNGVTFAAQLMRNFNDVATGAIAKNWITLDAATPDYLGAIISAGAALDEGNPDQGIDAYPDNYRAVFIRPTAKAELLKAGKILIGGSNYAQDILRRGGVDAETNPEVATTGYLGEIDNMPVYATSQAIWTCAERYLGLSAGALDGVKMLIVSGISTGRALAFNAAIKTVPSPLGQGIRIQPKYRFGAECWDALSVVPVVTSTFTNPATVAAPLKVLAPASRKFVAPVVASLPGGTVASGTTISLTCATPGADIYYTTDGSKPDATKTKYTAAIAISKTTTIRAVGIATDYVNSPIAAYTYTV